MCSSKGQESSPAKTVRRTDGPWPRTTPAILTVDSAPFDLHHTLMCGQSFRWREQGRGFVGVVSGRALRLEQKQNSVAYRSLPGEFPAPELRSYLGLDGVHAEAVRSFPEDAILRRAVRKFPGLRLLHQDIWETLISFIISSNNNIGRIRNCIEKLSRTFGEKIKSAPGFYSFPPPEGLADARLTILREKCNLGYRDRYVKETAREVARSPNLLSWIASLPYPHAKKEIMKLPGVGHKVADCVLLYSMRKFEAFPIDTWIRRIIQHSYFCGKPVPLSKIRAFAREHFGSFAGYAQLFLFYSALTKQSASWRR
jgi:N-glycosylase/DNA lyase